MDKTAKKITGLVKISDKVIGKTKNIRTIFDFKKKVIDVLTKEISEILAVILSGAVFLNASDIHFEPKPKETKIRLRIDGILADALNVETSVYLSLLSRLKLISGIKLNITDKPQDGRFSVLIKESKIENRVSTLPSEHGESVVLRILNPQSLINLEKLGLRKDLLNRFKKEIKRPNGMIITTGPTGSGKTTTLYAFLKKIQKPEIKIITIEDPIEYHLPSISQTQVEPKKGYDFANGLKAIMRQDPDVILVGEIRDSETANIALQASLTGHLVLTALHTNSAAGTIARLTNLGAKLTDISAGLNLVVAQRLVRKVCEKCSKLEKISSVDFQKLKKALKKVPKKIKIPKIKGCKYCNFTGYQGRIGLFEAFSMDASLQKIILANPSLKELKEKLIKAGMLTLYQDGLLKVLDGLTTIQEVERVSSEQ